ncbi:MAG TPA: hypothetical protein VKT29_13320 [Terriglobales bacterium]|nr:hypothetical protein [Terriglobales bacterium]
MKKFVSLFCLLGLSSVMSFAAALGTATQSVIPGDVQQIISVDYRSLQNSPTAQALKAQVLPENLKQFETSLRDIGLNPEKDVDQLTFVSYRIGKQGVKTVGIAQGQFTPRVVLKNLRLRKIKPLNYQNSYLYPMGNGMEMTFLDNSSLLFGDLSAIKGALDARNGAVPALDSNSQVSDMIGGVESGPVWSVLDAAGTQNMMRSALGQASQLADYNAVKQRLLGSRYVMDFSNGVSFDLDVLTADSMMAATMASLVKAGMMYRKLSATPTEKLAIDSTSVDSDGSTVKVHFQTDDSRFQSLLHSDLFAAVSH